MLVGVEFLFYFFIILYQVYDFNTFANAAYVGFATIAGFIWWFVYSDNGPNLPYSELVR